jgi:hypothetical protein
MPRRNRQYVKAFTSPQFNKYSNSAKIWQTDVMEGVVLPVAFFVVRRILGLSYCRACREILELLSRQGRELYPCVVPRLPSTLSLMERHGSPEHPAHSPLARSEAFGGGAKSRFRPQTQDILMGYVPKYDSENPSNPGIPPATNDREWLGE